MNPVVHFEMSGEDMDRMRKFYADSFGWETNQLGPEFGEYVTVKTSESDPDDPSGRPKTPGTINGGFYMKNQNPASPYPSVVIGVEDIREAMKKVEEAGGKVLGGQGGKRGEPDDIPGVGLYAAFIDTEGNRVGMIQPAPMP